MSEQQTPAKKTRAVGNVAGIGVVLALLGAFLIWRGNNLENPSTIGFLMVIFAAAFLITALVYWIKSKR